LGVATVICDVALLFPYLQDPDSGEFVFYHLGEANLVAVAIISAVGILGALSLFLYGKHVKKANS
jgi:hypothetical protein